MGDIETRLRGQHVARFGVKASHRENQCGNSRYCLQGHEYDTQFFSLRLAFFSQSRDMLPAQAGSNVA